MAVALSLTNIANLQNETTVVNAINGNNAAITTALQDAVSRSGTAPNTMSNNLDMNNFTILNLPAPTTVTSPLRLADLNTFIGGGTITSIPAGGVTNAALVKTSGTNYQVGWTSGGLVIANGKTSTTNNTLTFAGTDGTTLTFQGTDTYVSRTSTDTLTNKTLTNPTITGATITTSSLNGLTVTATTGTLTIGSGTLTLSDGKSFTINNTLTLAGTDATTITFQSTDTYVGRATTDTLTNKTIDTAGPNTLKISGVTLSTGQYPGTTTNDNATAGNVGEFVSSTVASGSAVSLTTGTAKTVTSISLTAGDWDVEGIVGFVPSSTTTMTIMQGGISTTTNTLPTVGGFGSFSYNINMSGSASNVNMAVSTGKVRLSLSGTTTVFLIASSAFAVSTMSGFGAICARRVR